MLHHLLPVSYRFTLLFLTVFLYSHSVFGQCTTNFNVGYRSVNGLVNAIGTGFRLDDWNNDGRRDFWYWRLNPDNATFSPVIFPSLSTGYWDWQHPVALSANVSSGLINLTPYHVKDFDGDGLTDIYVDRVYRNTAGSSLTALAQPVLTQQFQTFITLGFYDLDNDGKLDWLYGGRNPDGTTTSVRYQPWMANGTFGTAVTIYDTPNAEVTAASIAFTDTTGDGRKDVFVHFGSSASGSFRVLTNQGNGTFSAGPATVFDAYYNGVIRDMNNDGRADFVSYFQSKLVILYGQTNGTLNRVEYPSIAYIGITNPVADLNGDGFADILTFNNYTTGVGYAGYTTIINNAGSGFTSVSYQRKFKSLQNVEFTVEDVNNDGKADIYPTGASARASSPLNANAFNDSVFAVFENQCQKRPIAADSFADDNNADIATWNSSSGVWSWRNWDGVTSQGLAWGSPGDTPSPGDFDGDGRLDPTVYRNSTGQWFSLLSSTNTWNVIKFGLPGDIPVPNDYDGDGWTDIAVYRPSDGNWHFWYSRTQTYSSLHFGISEDKPVPADFDGDGKTDIAVYRPSQGTWYILKSTDLSVSINPYGIDTDIPLPADYDGDGKADIAVYRSGNWYIYRSVSNSSELIAYGLPTDVPVPFYRTGLSSDIVVYRVSNTKWYNRSLQSQDSPIMGGPSELPVRFGLSNN